MNIARKIEHQSVGAIGAMLCLLCVLWVVCPGPAAAQDFLTIYESADPATVCLDPYRGRGALNERFVSLYCRPLFQYKYRSRFGVDEYAALLAESIEADGGDSSRVIVTIKKDAMFYRYGEEGERKDSSRVTARDVVTTYKNLVNPRSELGSSWYADRLRKVIQDMRVLSDKKVLVLFKTGIPLPRWEKVLDFPIVPAAAIGEEPIIMYPNPRNRGQQAQEEYTQNPWGCGPFVLREKLERLGKIKYWFERVAPGNRRNFKNVYIESQNYQHLEATLKRSTGQCDCVPAIPIGLQNIIHEDFTSQELYNPIVEQIMFNLAPGSPLTDPRVRRALSMYINRKSLISEYNNEAYIVNGPMPFQYVFYCEECEIPYSNYDTLYADRLLQEAGYRRDDREMWVRQDGLPLRVEILGYVGTQGSIVAQIINHIAEGWKKFGVSSEAIPVPPGEYWSRLRNGEFHAAFHRLGYHIIPELNRYFVTGGKENYGGYSDPILDSLWRSWPTVSVAGTKKMWHQLHQRIGEMVPGAFLWTPQEYAAYSMWIDVGQKWYPYNFIGKIEEWEFAR